MSKFNQSAEGLLLKHKWFSSLNLKTVEIREFYSSMLRSGLVLVSTLPVGTCRDPTR